LFVKFFQLWQCLSNLCIISTRELIFIWTLSVVGVERSMSETARWMSRGRKMGTSCICDGVSYETRTSYCRRLSFFEP